MKMFELSVIVVVVIIGVCVLGGLLSTVWLGKDNPVEEVAEKVIQEETGINIDLTPSSKEATT